MGQVLNKKDFYYGAFIFALLNKKIHPAAIVESDDEDCQICSMCTDQHDDFKLIMKYRVARDAKDKDDWGCSFTLQKHDKQELADLIEKKEKVKLALICVREKLNSSEIALFDESEIRQLLSMQKDTFRIHFGKNSQKIDILLDYKPYFRITRNWQIAFERPFTQVTEQPVAVDEEKYDLMQDFQGKGRDPVKLEIDKASYEICSWKALLVQLCSWLVECDAGLFKSLARLADFQGRTRALIKMTETDMTKPVSVGYGIFVETNYSADDILMYSQRLVSAYQEKYQLNDKVFIFLKK